MRQSIFSSQIIALKNWQMAEHWGLVATLKCYMNNSLGQTYGCESMFRLRIWLKEKWRNKQFLIHADPFQTKSLDIHILQNQPTLEINWPSTSTKTHKSYRSHQLRIQWDSKDILIPTVPSHIYWFEENAVKKKKNNCMDSTKGPRHHRSNRSRASCDAILPIPHKTGHTVLKIWGWVTSLERILLGRKLSNFSYLGNRKSKVLFWRGFT